MHKITLLTTILLSCTGFAQTPDWTWGHNYESFNQDSRSMTAVDSSGNVYLVGNFRSASIAIGNETLTNVGAENTGDIYIVKFDADGNILWVKSEGGPGFDSVTSVAADQSGNVIIAGNFNNSITFETTAVTHNGNGSFLAKYNSDGDLVWAKTNSGQADMYSIYRIKADASDNIYMTGFFITPTVTFGSELLTNENFMADTANGTVFVAKFDADGNPVWAKGAQRTGICNFHNISSDLAIDESGNVFIGGYFFTDTIEFGGALIQNQNFGQPFPNVFMAKYDASGNLEWARSVTPGGFQNNHIYTVNTDNLGNVYFCGTFASSITIDQITLTASGSGSKMFVVKLNPAGNLIWAKTAAGNGYSGVDGADADADGNLYVGGTFNGSSIDFGSGNVDVSDQSGNLFVARYNALNGDVSWVRLGGPTDVNNRTSIDVKNEHEIFVGGYFFNSQIAFGDVVLQKTPTTDYNIFLTKLQAAALGSEDITQNTFEIYPNPVYDFAFVKNLARNSIFKVYDALGREIQSGVWQSENETLATANWPAGIYFLKVCDAVGESIKKIVKR